VAAREQRLPGWLTRLAEVRVEQVVEMRHVLRDGENELDAIAQHFLVSRFGAGFDDADHRALLDVIVSLGATYDVGDPLRWSPVNIDLLLVDRVPRKVVEKAGVLTKLPGLLRAFIRYAYDVRGWRAELRAEALADELEAAVGGEVELEQLTDDPLPDEPFEWLGVPEDIRPKLEEILALCDANADALLDVEHRTANRRLLHDVSLRRAALIEDRDLLELDDDG
jgi:hypothetical protein